MINDFDYKGIDAVHMFLVKCLGFPYNIIDKAIDIVMCMMPVLKL